MTELQYIEGIKNLSPRQIEILKAIYYATDHSITTKELAKVLNYKSFHGANRQVGAIGQILSRIDGVSTEKYFDRTKERPAYFELIGPYLEKKGWRMHDDLCKALEKTNIVNSDNNLCNLDKLPTEYNDFEVNEQLAEGNAIKVLVNKYERNTKARQECVQFHGFKCKICGFDFQEFYGDIATGFVHIHHIKPLSEINNQYVVDPINDLIPLCANCHSVIHLKKPAMKIEELKKRIKIMTINNDS